MNSISLDSVLISSYKNIHYNPIDQKYFWMYPGYKTTPSNNIVDYIPKYLSKPLKDPFSKNPETVINFNSYTDSTKILLYDYLCNRSFTKFSYPLTDLANLKSISGVVNKNGIPAPLSIVRLHDKSSGLVLKECRSDSFGYFIFSDILPYKEYYIISFDSDGEMNAVVLSGVRT